MPTLGECVRRIRVDIDRGTDYDLRIKEAISDAVVWYKARRYGFNSKRATFQTAEEFTSLTADWIEVDALQLESGTEIDPLEEVNWGQIQNRKLGSNWTSRPTYYAIQNRQLRLYPTPDVTYSFRLVYLYDAGAAVSASASDSLSNVWLEEGYELVRSHATADLLELFIGGPENEAKADKFRMRAVAAEKELKRRANREQGPGIIQPFL